MGSALGSLSQWFPLVCQSSFCLFQVFTGGFHGMFHHWHIPQLLFFWEQTSKTYNWRVSESPDISSLLQGGTVWYVQNGELWRGFETILYLPKNLKPQWGVTQHKMVYWNSAPCCATASTEWHQKFPQLKDFFPEEDIYLVLLSKQGNRIPWWSKAGLFGAQSQDLNGNSRSVNNSGEHSIFFSTFLHPLSSDLLTERQVGVGVQVTGASIVAISVTQLTARCYSAICATGGWRNNGC